MSAHLTKHCINCEEQIPTESALRDSPQQLDNKHSDDFCSSECERDYLLHADKEVLQRESNTNPDALPVPEWGAKPAHSTPRTNSNTDIMRTSSNKVNDSMLSTGILPPNSIEAISSLLQTSSNAEIERAVKHLTKDKPNESSKT